MARTREEHIEKLGDALSAGYSSVALAGMRRGLAKQHILEAEQRGYERARDECAEDTKRLEWLESRCCDLRFRSEPIADTGDADVFCDVIGHYMGNPKERTLGSAETLRSAIDAAMKEDGQ